jgi:hypothetical protein
VAESADFIGTTKELLSSYSNEQLFDLSILFIAMATEGLEPQDLQEVLGEVLTERFPEESYHDIAFKQYWTEANLQ